MDFSHYSDDPVRLAVDLVNTYEVVSRQENLETPADLQSFIDVHGEGWDPPTSVALEDLHEVRALRTRLRATFEAEDARQAAEVLNGILADVGARPRVSLHGDGPHLHFEPDNGRPAHWLGSIAAMGLGVALIEGGFERFGTCSSSTCDDVFVDTSRNRSRRHCSDTCTTREGVAAFRRRQRRS